MTQTIRLSLMKDFSHYISNEMGLYFPENRLIDLRRGISAAAKEFAFTDVEECMEWLMTASLSQEQTETLASFLTIGETYFFREEHVFRILESRLLPDLIYKKKQTDRTLRIWSAGCATGEEPYTLSIILNKLIPDIKNWNITILATDINTDFLAKLSKGVYTEWSFRNVPTHIKNCYFSKVDTNKYQINSRLQEIVKPAYLNLSQNEYPSVITNTNAIDIILCRNVLMYFSPVLIEKILQRFYHCLNEDGWFIPGLSESFAKMPQRLNSERIDGVPFYKKVSHPFEVNQPHALGITPPQNTPPPTVVAEPPRPVVKVPSIEDLANAGSLVAALQSCDASIRQDKMNPDLHYMRALILSELNESAELLAALNRVLYLDPNHILAHVFLGKIYRKKNATVRSHHHFELAIALLSLCDTDAVLPLSGGMTSHRLIHLIHSVLE